VCGELRESVLVGGGCLFAVVLLRDLVWWYSLGSRKRDWLQTNSITE